jgi:exopolysaccharide biosynthesis polyprenyl glycosylphosphotransferase
MERTNPHFDIWEISRPVLFRFFVIIGDLVAVACAYTMAYFVRFTYEPSVGALPPVKSTPLADGYVSIGPIILFMWFLAFLLEGCYRRMTIPALDEAIRVFRGSMLAAILSMSAMFLVHDISYSRLVFIIGGLFGFLFTYGYRELLKMSYLLWVRMKKRPRRVLVLGEGYLSLSLRKILERQGDRAVLTCRDFNLEKIKRTILRSRIREVLLANPSIAHKEAVQLAEFCEAHLIPCRLLPDILEIRMGEVQIDESLGIPTFHLKSGSLYGTAFLAKRIMDIAAASLVVGVLFIPIVFICLLIKLTSKGPVLYFQERVGYKGQVFRFYKFRSMIQGAEAMLDDLRKNSDRSGPVFKMKEDPRVTWIGKFIRKYSIDEIPQLINVLLGDMSMVGPRPQVIWETHHNDEWANKRLNVLPGITGLWQVSGRAELTYEEMIELDIFYIENWSPGLDMKIILKTIPAVLFTQGAY